MSIGKFDKTVDKLKKLIDKSGNTVDIWEMLIEKSRESIDNFLVSIDFWSFSTDFLPFSIYFGLLRLMILIGRWSSGRKNMCRFNSPQSQTNSKAKSLRSSIFRTCSPQPDSLSTKSYPSSSICR